MRSQELERSTVRKQRLRRMKRKHNVIGRKKPVTLKALASDLQKKNREYNKTKPRHEHRTTSKARLKDYIREYSRAATDADR